MALWFKVMKSWKPDAIDFVGDIDDQIEYSRFSEGTTDEFFAQIKKQEDPSPIAFIEKNAAGARDFYTKVRRQHPNANLHASLGNHDIRIFGYVDKKAPEYLPMVTPNIIWSFEDLGITYKRYDDKPFERFGEIYVHHGNTTSTTGPTALKEAVDYGVSYIRGHSHRSIVAAKHYPVANRTLHAMETGHMCDPSQYGIKYSLNPDWDIGFGLVQISESGAVQMNFIRISPDYECIVDGKVFAG